jgi:allantoin racemase
VSAGDHERGESAHWADDAQPDPQTIRGCVQAQDQLEPGGTVAQADDRAHRRWSPGIAVENAVAEAEAAILEDGAEVITLGCSGVFWLQPFIKRGLEARGWDVPVLEGYRAAIEHAKMLINLGLTASGITFMADNPKRVPRKIIP